MYDDSAVVIEDAEILAIPKDDFLHMIYNDIGIASKFIHIISKNVKEKEERLLNLAYNSLRKRVATGACRDYRKIQPERTNYADRNFPGRNRTVCRNGHGIPYPYIK